MFLDPAQDLGSVDLANHDVGRADGRGGERVAPAVGVEHRERVQVDVAVRDRSLPAEDRGVEPVVAVRQLHTLGPRSGSGGVVDGGGGVLLVDRIGVPRLGVGGLAPDLVVVIAEDELVRAVDLVDQVRQVRIDHQHLGAGVLDDVADLGDAEAEVDRDQDAAPPGDAEEGTQHAG